MDRTYAKRFPMYTFDVDFEGKARLPVLLDLLQDVAREHAALLKVSIFDLQAKGLTWVVSRYHIRVSRYPVMGDTVEVRTWPSGKRGVFALRDFEARDGEGRLLLEATSSWLVITLDSKQPVRMETVFLDENILDRRAVADDFERLPSPVRADRETSFTVLSRDLDFNRHVNNVVYVHWAIEGMPEDFLCGKRPAEVEIVYKAEAFLREEVLSRVELPPLGGTACLHQIVRKEDGAELARLRTSWL
ncbi:MAG TPA: acyl-ACP thioesterase domain-containing protein [Acidobacteriota bacterium]|nr:acyl-ACP thioesterase domain-containing protein [Acidobacteriota bacterium]